MFVVNSMFRNLMRSCICLAIFTMISLSFLSFSLSIAVFYQQFHGLEAQVQANKIAVLSPRENLENEEAFVHRLREDGVRFYKANESSNRIAWGHGAESETVQLLAVDEDFTAFYDDVLPAQFFSQAVDTNRNAIPIIVRGERFRDLEIGEVLKLDMGEEGVLVAKMDERILPPFGERIMQGNVLLPTIIVPVQRYKVAAEVQSVVYHLDMTSVDKEQLKHIVGAIEQDTNEFINIAFPHESYGGQMEMLQGQIDQQLGALFFCVILALIVIYVITVNKLEDEKYNYTIYYLSGGTLYQAHRLLILEQFILIALGIVGAVCSQMLSSGFTLNVMMITYDVSALLVVSLVFIPWLIILGVVYLLTMQQIKTEDITRVMGRE